MIRDVAALLSVLAFAQSVYLWAALAVGTG